MAVLQKYQGGTEDTIVFDTIGITDTTGNMVWCTRGWAKNS